MLSHIMSALLALSHQSQHVVRPSVVRSFSSLVSIPYRVTVIIKVPQGAEEEVGNLIKFVQAKSLQEPGCEQFTVHTDTSNGTTFVITESWKDKAAQELQLNKKYIFIAKTRLGLLNPVRYEKYLGPEIK